MMGHLWTSSVHEPLPRPNFVTVNIRNLRRFCCPAHVTPTNSVAHHPGYALVYIRQSRGRILGQRGRNTTIGDTVELWVRRRVQAFVHLSPSNFSCQHIPFHYRHHIEQCSQTVLSRDNENRDVVHWGVPNIMLLSSLAFMNIRSERHCDRDNGLYNDERRRQDGDYWAARKELLAKALLCCRRERISHI